MTYETHLDKARQSKKKHNELRLIRTRKPVSEAGLGEFVQGGGGKASTSGWWAHTAVLVARTLPPPPGPCANAGSRFVLWTNILPYFPLALIN